LEKQLREKQKKLEETVTKASNAPSPQAIAQTAQLEQDLKDLKEKYHLEKEENNSLQKNKKKIEKQIATMEDKLTDATFNVTKLERKTKQLEEENHELQEQLNDDTSSREMIQFKSTKEKELAELRENWLTAKEKMDAQQQNLLREITNLKEKLEKEEVNSVNLKKKYKKNGKY